MQTVHPDIVVVSPDGEYLIIVEVKLSDRDTLHHQSAVSQLRHLMAATGCSVGFAVSNERISLLRDSFEKFNGESISVVGEAKLPNSLLPPSDGHKASGGHKRGEHAFEFESRVQEWLETLKLTSNIEKLPNDLRALFKEPIVSLLQWGEIRAAHPRWSGVAN